MDKRHTVETFRERLTQMIDRSGLSRAQFAARAGLDRSTLSQLLSPGNVRLPRAETIARIATRHSASVDWLLGLSQEDQVATDIVPQLVIEPDASRPADERLAEWHEQARGYKVRYVPATLPDQLKTEEVIAYETGRLNEASAAAWRDVAHKHIDHAREPSSEIEVCLPVQSFTAFARGEAAWCDLSAGARHAQLVHMADRLDSRYPSYRCFLFDQRERFSVPYTVFGPQRAAIYVGDMYFVFNSTEHIRVLTGHFDDLIRHARIQPHEASGYLRTLASEIS
jgi:transcriptional regulator with XRE-family HTH domain